MSDARTSNDSPGAIAPGLFSCAPATGRPRRASGVDSRASAGCRSKYRTILVTSRRARRKGGESKTRDSQRRPQPSPSLLSKGERHASQDPHPHPPRRIRLRWPPRLGIGPGPRDHPPRHPDPGRRGSGDPDRLGASPPVDAPDADCRSDCSGLLAELCSARSGRSAGSASGRQPGLRGLGRPRQFRCSEVHLLHRRTRGNEGCSLFDRWELHDERQPRHDHLQGLRLRRDRDRQSGGRDGSFHLRQQRRSDLELSGSRTAVRSSRLRRRLPRPRSPRPPRRPRAECRDACSADTKSTTAL